MKKALLICLAIIVGCSLLAGCGSKREDTQYVKYNTKVFDVGNYQRIYIDKETGVQYIILYADRGVGVSVRLDADGKPMVDESVRK